ncbi:MULTISPECIES: isochorismatase family cysteine hydrolase [Niastella]|uniref:Cysteine hydrolase n=1 Tax=Niastella soli TaxID=2821487 RepID=A0ABS3YTF5_9BACT|nr:isochorismatase family cysteine hydrolase [Niastella soli]MBO9200486.1 cysteine hydrolase [Niastella soli]
MNTFNTQSLKRYGGYLPHRTGILLVDPYNDFLHPEGKAYGRSKEVIEGVHLLDNMERVIQKARELRMQVFFVPHHRAEPTDFKNWKYPNALQLRSHANQVFAKGTWGGEFHERFQPTADDVIIKEHWGSSGFANTDLDEQLKQHDIDRVILIGMIANTCIEATGRFAMELGYNVTLVTDATAANSFDNMRAAHEINAPNYAHFILTTEEVIELLSQKEVTVNK